MDPFDQVRSEPDPERRAKLAGELIIMYQQRSAELARVRKAAIGQMQRESGLTGAEVGRRLQLSKGRISQIKQDAPPAERAFFGVGPVTIAVPLREVPARALPVIASEDARARDNLRQMLELRLAFLVQLFGIPPGGAWEPTGDVVAICGPKSSPVSAQALESDPVLSFLPDTDGRWAIRDRRTGSEFISPMDSGGDSVWSDVAYLGRLQLGQQRLLVIAGVHALGSVGAVDYLLRELDQLYRTVGENRFSMVIGSSHDGDSVISSEAVIGPCLHE